MSPDTFSHNVGAWLAALTALVAPLITFIGAIFGILAYLKSHTNELRLNGQSGKIDTLQTNSLPAALFLAPPPVAVVPVTVVVPDPAAVVPVPAAEVPPPIVELPPPIVEPPPRPITVTITADAPLDAAVIQAAHAALDARAAPDAQARRVEPLPDDWKTASTVIGPSTGALTTNALSTNALSTNALSTNALSTNALSTNPLTLNTLPNGGTPQ